MFIYIYLCFFFSSRRRHTRWPRDWSSDVCSSDLIDMEDQKIQEVCEDLFDPEFYDGSTLPLWLVLGLATPTDFRQSPLRIHLDDDISSGHMTGGYYDTLTTCRKEVPIADDDIELFTCGAAVDSISFRLRYYAQPRLAEEYLTAE